MQRGLRVGRRGRPTSPASSFGAAVTSTLKTRVTRAPCPMPKTMSPMMVGTVSQLLVTTNESQIKAPVVSAKEKRAMTRGLNRP